MTMTREELEAMDLRVWDLVYIYDAGTGAALAERSIVVVDRIAGEVIYAAGFNLMLHDYYRFYRLARVGENLSGHTVRMITAGGLGDPITYPDDLGYGALFPQSVITAYPEPPESPEQIAKLEALEELSRAREALAAAEAKVEALA